MSFEDEDQNEDINTDSISFGSASKGSAKKIYGNILTGAKDMGIKVYRIKLLERLALGEIDINKYNEEVEKIK